MPNIDITKPELIWPGKSAPDRRRLPLAQTVEDRIVKTPLIIHQCLVELHP